MNVNIVTDYRDIPFATWADFVHNHPNGNIFQTPEMFSVYQSTDKYEPMVIACFDEGKLYGILLALIQREFSGILGQFTARSIIIGGPLIQNNDIRLLGLILDTYNHEIKRRAIYTQFRNMWQMDWAKKKFEERGFIFEDHLNILVDLGKSEDELWKAVHSKRRNEIRRAYKENTIFKAENSINTLRVGYNILREVYGRAKLPLPQEAFFLNALKYSSDTNGLRLFGAVNDGKIIGAMFVLCYKGRIYDWYAGALKEFYNKYPNDLIPWEVFKWGKKKGFNVFDFGGAGKPGVPYGVRDYKMKFGGQLINVGRFQKIHNQSLMKLARIGFKLWQKVQ